ncbi:hypothetical protein SMICM304S_03566 [Streptomyces microflavus]
MCGPTPRARATFRSSPVSTSRRTESTPGSVISTATRSQVPAADRPPKAGRNSVPPPQDRNIVPIPAASRRNAGSGSKIEHPSQFSRAQGRQIRVERGHRDGGESARTERAPYARAALSPAAGTSGTTRAPSAEGAAPAAASSVTTTTSRTRAQESAAATVSWAKARASRGRASSPAARPKRLLARARGFNGTTRDQSPAGSASAAISPSVRMRTYSRLPVRQPGGPGPKVRRTVFSTEEGPGARLDRQ